MAAGARAPGLGGGAVPRVYRALGRVQHEFASAPMRSSPFADNPWFLCVVVTILLATVLLIGGTRSSLAHAGRAVAAAPKSRVLSQTLKQNQKRATRALGTGYALVG
ncbi:hypothetical protein PPROV_001073900 [Pycnococcus provasolii]|uniref:Uncharacterized protein n=1 Tax=Pycnococcus provasolii TaxID=41880 RepID=A0A830HXP4_9CHLO|nr:hypothetical protein PPROV_001073900 [Pycnococcus provasolii]